jgi:diacylglycerol O-acyltransferase
MNDMSHLSVVDGAFLHMESPEMPMHVGSLTLLEPPPGEPSAWFEVLKAHVTSRMHLAPVFTRKLALMPFDLANPVWIRDDDIDLDYHIRYIVLPKPGTMAQLEAVAARLHSSLLDRSRPLWEIYVIEGLADGRLGFYSKVHHAAVDGQAAVAMSNSVFDLTPEPRRVRPPRTVRSNRYQLGMAELLSAALGNSVTQLVHVAKLLPPLAGAAFGAAREALAARRERSNGSEIKKISALKLAPPTPFNESITNQRTFAAVSLPLAEVKAIGKPHGASVNDMVLWLCSTALREFLRDAHQLPAKSLVAGVPISLRNEGDSSSNNQVSGTVVDLATQLDDPLERLAAIMAGTKAMKVQMGNFGSLIPTDFPSFGSPWLISGLASLYGRSRLASRMRMANVTISNVPGPQVPLYLAGAKITGIYPLSIVVHGVALNITVQSYMGQLCFGLIACRRAVPDMAELAHQMQRAMRAALALPTVDKASEREPAKSMPAATPAKAPAKTPAKAAPKAAGQAVKAKPAPGASQARRARGVPLKVVPTALRKEPAPSATADRARRSPAPSKAVTE